MYFSRFTLGAERFVGEFHRRACGEHRVADNQRFTIDARRRHILDMDEKFCLVDIFSISRDESVFGVVEHVVHALMERQSGAENRSENDRLTDGVACGCAQTSGGRLLVVANVF